MLNWQRVPLDHQRILTYLAVASVLGACAPRYGPTLLTVLPVGLTPAATDSASVWAAAGAPTTARSHRFKWKLESPDEDVGGSGRVRIAPPDSLHLVMAGPLGAKRTSGVVVGDSLVWASRDEVLDRIIPAYPLLWAMLGITRPVVQGTVSRAMADSSSAAWEVVVGADTVEYVRAAGPAPALTALVRSAGRLIGRVETRYDSTGAPKSSRLYVPDGPSRLELNFTENTIPATIEPGLWAPPDGR